MKGHPIYVEFVLPDCTCEWTDVRPVAGQATTIMKMTQRDPHCSAYASDPPRAPQTGVSRDEVAAMIEAAVDTLRQELLAPTPIPNTPTWTKTGGAWTEHAADCHCQWAGEGARIVQTFTDPSCRVSFIGPGEP